MRQGVLQSTIYLDGLGYTMIHQQFAQNALGCAGTQHDQHATNMYQQSTRSTRIAVEAASLEVAVQVPIETSQVGGASTLKFARI